MQLFISEVGLTVVGVIYLPIVVWALRRMWAKLPARGPKRVAAITLALGVVLAVPFWDVAITSLQMAQLCPKAGVSLKRSVKADGFYTNLGGADLLDRGFDYAEVQNGNLIRIYERIGNEVKEQIIDTTLQPYVPRSRYELIYGDLSRYVGTCT